MKKLFLFFTGVWFAASSVQAAETSGIFSDNTFTIAAAVKLGRSAGVTSAPKYSGLNDGGTLGGDGTGGGKTELNVCSTDADCNDDEKCSNNACVPACSATKCDTGKLCVAKSHGTCKTPCELSPCSDGLKCINNGDTTKCVKCITDSDCGSNGVCTANNLCLYRIVNLCRNKICPKGNRCFLGRCEPYPLGSTNDPQCSSTQVADGNGGCTLKAVNAVRLQTLNNDLKLPATTALRWHPQLNVCLPKLEYKFVADDFKLVTKPFPYTGLVRAVELDDTLTDKSVVKLIEATPVKFNGSLTVKDAVQLRADPVLVKAVTTNDDILTIQKTPAITASPTLQQLKVAQ